MPLRPKFLGGGKNRPEKGLEQSLAAALSDPGARPGFYREFLEADVFVIGTAEGPSIDLGDGRHLSQGQSLRSLTYEREGRAVVPVFTSIDRMHLAVPSDEEFARTKWLRMRVRDLLASLDPEVGLVLNPFSPFAKEFPPDEVRALVEGTIFRAPSEFRIPKGQTIYIRRPAASPERLLRALRTYFDREKVVVLAHLGEIYAPSTGQPAHLVIGIGLKHGEESRLPAVLRDLSMVIEGELGGGQLVDIVPLTGTQISRILLEETESFYP